MGGPIKASCLGEEAEKTVKGQMQGEKLAFCRAPAKLPTYFKGPRRAVFGCKGTLKIDPIMKVLCITINMTFKSNKLPLP